MRRLFFSKSRQPESLYPEFWLCDLFQSESRPVLSESLQPHGLYSPWNSPGQNTGVGSISLLQGIFPTLWLNPDLPYCRQILYHLSHKGSPKNWKWKLCLEMLRGLKQNLCVPGPRNPTETETELCLSTSCGGPGQQWTAAGARGSGCRLGYGISPLGGGHH